MSSEDSLIGTLLGDYQILDEIGHGGMGIVYRARQQSLDRIVAVKILPPEFCADPGFVERFLREARSAANLNHAHVVQVFDAGVQDGIYFFVMEYVDGKSLGQILEDHGPMQERAALVAIQQAAKGLNFAHGLGVIHRDVKPDNLMMLANGTVKVGDLGLAKRTMEESNATLTNPKAMMGTPYYVAPEQIRGLPNVDGRADIYALGMTLYHLLTGKPAFDTGTAPEIMAQHLAEEPPSLKAQNPLVSETCCALFRKMTAKKRENRIQQMSEVVDIIDDMLGDSRGSRARKRKGTTSASLLGDGWFNRFLRATGYGVLMVLVLGGSFLLYLKFKPKKSVSRSPPLPETISAVKIESPPVKQEVPLSKTAVSEEIPHTSKKPDSAKSKRIIVNGLESICMAVISREPVEMEGSEFILKFGSDGNRVSKVLIRPDFLRSAKYAELISKSKDWMPLKIPVVNGEHLVEGNFVAYKMLVPWGQKLVKDTKAVSALGPAFSPRLVSHRTEKALAYWNDYIRPFKEEVSWEYASIQSGIKWNVPGADGVGTDRSDKSLKVTFETKSTGTDGKKECTAIVLYISNDLREWSKEVEKNGFFPHYGWVLQFADDRKGVVGFSAPLAGNESEPKIAIAY